jgi:hypothetical protein
VTSDDAPLAGERGLLLPTVTEAMEASIQGEPVTDIYRPAGLAVLATNAVKKWLTSPDAWDLIAEAIGDHSYEYDLGDSSHRLDVVQIVCQAAARAASASGGHNA